MEVTQLEAQYVDQSKLRALLEDIFGGNYRVKSQDDVMEITAERKLTSRSILLQSGNAASFPIAVEQNESRQGLGGCDPTKEIGRGVNMALLPQVPNQKLPRACFEALK
ncbi:hypothetical protein F5Y16DRAFT_352770 [Xylariaceae sp. FL0255]|nr:hypothetical protein F5Y16DRAFT_352770 [Xylariaceae sp. FL0255]